VTREFLERHQVWLYLAAIAAGLWLGTTAPAVAPVFERVLWPVLGLLLYATFTQVPLVHLPVALRDRRFMAAVLTGNFLLVPLLVWVLLALAPADPAVRLGILMVLLVPCTDWFITFTHLARGDTGRAIAVTPIVLLVQITLLPLYLWLFMGRSFAEIMAAERVLTVFLTLIVLPLFAAWLTERWVEQRPERAVLTERLAWLPVPLLAAVVFLIAAAQVTAVIEALPVLDRVFLVFLLYLIGAPVIALVLARLARLAPKPSRTLVFSLGSRNSFVVLPLALALPQAWQTAVVVIVMQSLVELFGMIAYLWAVPRWLAGERRTGR